MATYARKKFEVRQDIAAQLGSLLVKGTASATGATTSKVPSVEFSRFSEQTQVLGLFIYLYDGTASPAERVITAWATGSPPTVDVHTVLSVAPDATTKLEVHRLFSPTELNDAIDRAHRRMAHRLPIPTVDDGNITLVKDVFEYLFPAASNLIAVTDIYKEGKTVGTFDVFIPREHWEILQGTKKLLFDNRYNVPEDTKKLRLVAYKRPTVPATETANVDLEDEYLINRVVSWMLPRRAWAERDSFGLRERWNVAEKYAEEWERRLNVKVAPGTRWIETQ